MPYRKRINFNIKSSAKVLRVNIITSFTEIIGFNLTFDKVNTDKVFEFISSTIENFKERKSGRVPIYLVLDNGPKNRSKRLLKYIE